MLANISSAMIMCGSNLLSYVPPSGLFHFFHSAKYICMWKVKNPWGVYTTFYFTVELSAGLKYLLKNSTMLPDASNLVLCNVWVKFNVVHTPFLIFSLFAMMCILQNEKSEISRGGYVRPQIWTTHYGLVCVFLLRCCKQEVGHENVNLNSILNFCSIEIYLLNWVTHTFNWHIHFLFLTLTLFFKGMGWLGVGMGRGRG